MELNTELKINNMKEYFKYANGYININDENIFLTNSGNWSETNKLMEKSPKSIRKNQFKGFKIYIYLFVLACIILLVLSKSKSGSIPVGIILLGLAVYTYMKRETGKQYKITISKIKEITISENQTKIIFLNEANVEDFEILNNVEGKGIEILEEILSDLKK